MNAAPVPVHPARGRRLPGFPLRLPPSRAGLVAGLILLAAVTAAAKSKPAETTAAKSKSVITSEIYSATAATPPPSGIVYSLPKKLALVSFTREKVDFQKLLEAQAKAQTAFTAAEKALGDAKKKVAGLKTQVEQAADEAKATLEKALALAQVEQKVAEIDFNAAKVALDEATLAVQFLTDSQWLQAQIALTEARTALRASIKKVADLETEVKRATEPAAKEEAEKALAQAKEDEKKATRAVYFAVEALDKATGAVQLVADRHFRDTVSVVIQAAVPDTTVFVASPQHSKWRTDTFNLKTTEAGLLEGYVGTAADKTGEVVIKTIEAIRNVIALAGGGAGFKASQLHPQQGTMTPFKYERLVDPANPDDMKKVNQDLKARGAGCHLVVTPSGSSRDGCAAPTLTGIHPGLLYRRPVQRMLVAYDVSKVEAPEITDDVAESQGKYMQSVSLLLPNGGPVAVLDLKASRMVTTEFDFAFKDGMLISFKSVRPSEALAWASLIPQALSAIIAIPTELIQLKVDYSTKDKALTDAKKASLDSELELLKAQQAIEAARLQAASGSAP